MFNKNLHNKLEAKALIFPDAYMLNYDISSTLFKNIINFSKQIPF